MLSLYKAALELRIDKVFLAGLLLSLALLVPSTQAETREFKGVTYRLHYVDLSEQTLEIFLNDAAGNPYNTFRNLEADLNKQGKRLQFAMNAGIYEPGWIPSGLHIEGGKTILPLNRNPPPPKQPGQYTPNFYLQPNGVFFIDDQGAGVLETEAYAKSDRKPRLATQSGPLLLQKGKIHPAFNEPSTSRLIRNGVGVDSKGRIVLVATDRSAAGQINLYNFASLFLSLDCQDALYLDGDISEFYLRSTDPVIQNTTAFAAILAITEPLP